ncbi:MAG: PadR family transcriptional regulator [Gemmatimonas sp.]|nr:PadR family transcriptional regulator [Gemmatimonas sp.]
MRKRRELESREAARVDELLPVRPAAFALLAALAEGPRPGFEILERVNEVVPSRPLFGPGTLYRLMRELRQAKWIERTTAPEGDEGASDERRQYHGLTKLGGRVLAAESARLRRTLVMVGRLGESQGTP